MSRLQAVLFDMDGLLVDSEPLWTIAEEELASSLGRTWTLEIKQQVMGTRLDVAVPAILTAFGLPVTDERVAHASRFLLRRMVELYDASVPLRPGALALLTELRGQVPVALVSSSFRVLVDAVLRTLGPDTFATSVAGDEVTRGKPDPEPYLLAAGRLSADPARCVVLEDSEPGLRSGEAAGCRVVGVPETAPLAAAPGRLIVGSLAELSLSRLAELVG